MRGSGASPARDSPSTWRACCRAWLVHVIVALLFVANTVNIGADLAAMGAAARLVLGWGEIAFAVAFAAGSMLLQVFVPYHRYVHVLKWLTLSLLAYVGVVFTVAIDWGAVVRGMFWPQVAFSRETMVAIVAVFGTTISPYMFFWQSAEEVEDETAGRRRLAPRSSRSGAS